MPAGIDIDEIEYDLGLRRRRVERHSVEAEELVAELTSLTEARVAQMRSRKLEKGIERVHSLL